MIRKATLLVCLFAIALPSWARADTPTTLSPGARVRVTVLRGVETGKLLALDPARLVLASDPSYRDTLRIDRSRIDRLELSVGRKRHGWAGAGIGLLVGGGIGALIGDSQPKTGWLDLGAAVGAAVGGGSGLVLGALIGHGAWVSDRWQTVPPDSQAVADARGTIVPSRPAQGLRDR